MEPENRQDTCSPELFEAFTEEWNDDIQSEISSVLQIVSAVRGLAEWSNKQECSQSSLKDSDLDGDDELLQRICCRIGLLNSSEFSDLEEQLFVYLIKEWPSIGCFRTLEFVTDIFCYICTIVTNVNIVKDYLFYFSQPSMPAHVKLYLYPAIVHIANKRFPERFQQETRLNSDFFITTLEQYSLFSENRQKSNSNISVASASKFMTFWKDAFQFYLKTESSNFDSKILTGLICSYSQFTAVCTVERHRMTMIKLFALCLRNKPNRTTLLMSSLFFVFLQSLKFTRESWATMKYLIGKLSEAASHFKNDETVTQFISSALSSFFQSVDVDKESFIREVSSLKCIQAALNDSDNITIQAEVVGGVTHSTNSNLSIYSSFLGHSTDNNDIQSQNSNDSGSGSSHSSQQNKENFEVQSTSIVTSSPPNPVNNSININRNSVTENNSAPDNFGNISTTLVASEKTLDLLEKLVKKMKSSKVKLSLDSDKNKLKFLISELNGFL